MPRRRVAAGSIAPMLSLRLSEGDDGSGEKGWNMDNRKGAIRRISRRYIWTKIAKGAELLAVRVAVVLPETKLF